MGLSLAFHIVFAAAGIALPVLMVLSDLAYRRTRDADYLLLSQKLAKGAAILFAVGAVSGTVLSFELGLLWPRFMGTYGQVIGLPFSFEAFAFFTEAIFLGIYLYGRERVSPGLHLFSGIAVAVSGAASAFFVVLVNAFMNDPAGFKMTGGRVTEMDPLRAMFSPGWSYETLHTLLSCYQATAFVMVGIHAVLALRYPAHLFHCKALRIALPLACLSALVQPLVGDRSAHHVAEHQPLKLAAMEAHFHTGRGAPLRVGGFPDEATASTPWAFEVPFGLSVLAFADPHAEVKGLTDFPRDEWPPVARTHLAFDVMVGAGTVMAALALLTALMAWRRRRLSEGLPDWLLKAWVAASPLGLVAMEAGWLVTEYGRQPWVVRGFLRTRDAVTPVPGLSLPFFAFFFVYLFLGAMVTVLLWRQIRATVPGRGEHAVAL